MTQPGGEAAIQQFHITPVVEEQSRTYEGGVAQSFLGERGLLRVSYFHNQYGRQIEPVPATEVPALLPQLNVSQRQALESLIGDAGDLDRPFNRPPNTDYAAVSYNGEQFSVGFTAAFATRSDDSTFLAGRDLTGGN